jgi:hypothetical protein
MGFGHRYLVAEVNVYQFDYKDCAFFAEKSWTETAGIYMRFHSTVYQNVTQPNQMNFNYVRY